MDLQIGVEDQFGGGNFLGTGQIVLMVAGNGFHNRQIQTPQAQETSAHFGVGITQDLGLR